MNFSSSVTYLLVRREKYGHRVCLLPLYSLLTTPDQDSDSFGGQVVPGIKGVETAVVQTLQLEHELFGRRQNFFLLPGTDPSL